MTLCSQKLMHATWACGVLLIGGAVTHAGVVDDIERDRPRVAVELDERSTVREWIEEQFSGDAIAMEVHWSPDEPISGRAAEHEYLTARGPVVVRVSQTRSALDQLAALIFELHNMHGYRVFDQVYLDAVTGKIGPEEYALRNLGQEYEALVATRAFLTTHFRDVPSRELSGHKVLRALLAPVPTLEAQLAEARKGRGDVGEFYHDAFEAYVVPERDLRARIDELNNAFARCDVDALDGLLSDKYRHTDGGDIPLTKSQWLAHVGLPTDNACVQLGNHATGGLDIVITGDTAIVTGHTCTVESDNGERISIGRQFTSFWRLERGSWKRAAFHGAIR